MITFRTEKPIADSSSPSQQNLIGSKVKSKEHCDNTSEVMKLQVGDKVLLSDENERQGISCKLSAQWIGPYTIRD